MTIAEGVRITGLPMLLTGQGDKDVIEKNGPHHDLIIPNSFAIWGNFLYRAIFQMRPATDWQLQIQLSDPTEA
jgi:hypothetical protein